MSTTGEGTSLLKKRVLRAAAIGAGVGVFVVTGTFSALNYLNGGANSSNPDISRGLGMILFEIPLGVIGGGVLGALSAFWRHTVPISGDHPEAKEEAANVATEVHGPADLRQEDRRA